MIGYRAIIFEVREKRAIKLRSSPRPGVVSKGTASHLIKTAPSVVFFVLCAKPKTLKLPQLEFPSAGRWQRDLTLECSSLRA